MRTTRKLLGTAAIATLFLSTGCTTASPDGSSLTSDQSYVNYQQLVNVYQDGVLQNSLRTDSGTDTSEATLDRALEHDAKLSGLIMKPIGDRMIAKASKRDKKEAVAAANQAAQVELEDRINAVVAVLYDEGIISHEDVAAAAEKRDFKPGEIDTFFSNGFPTPETIKSNDGLGWLVYYLGDSHIDINQYQRLYESVFYESHTGALNGDYFRQPS